MLNLVLLAFSCLLNIQDKKMLALTAIVGAGIFVPIYYESPWQWFFKCICIEAIVISGAIIIQCQASRAIAMLSSMMIVCHFIAGSLYLFTDVKEYSYNVIIPTIETLQIVALCLFSRIFTDKAAKIWM